MLPTLDRTTAHQHHSALIAALRQSGALRAEAWISAFKDTPRDMFLEAFAVHDPVSGQRTSHDLHAADPDARATALAFAYTDRELLTQVDREQSPTSSCPQPSLLARLLEALDVRENHRVLQIGTGPGYTAALLCHQVGAGNVTTIELDRELAALAAHRLACLGHRPEIRVGDGRVSTAGHGHYDRLIATCSTPRIPRSWINQVRPGGVIIANLGSGFIRLVVQEDETASGYFLPLHGRLTPLRDNDTDHAATDADLIGLIKNVPHVSRRVTIPHGLTHPMVTLLMTLRYPDLQRLIQLRTDGVRHVLISPGARSFADVHINHHDRAPEHDRGHLREPGADAAQWNADGSLWDGVAAIAQAWSDRGQLPVERHGITVTADGGHLLWCDDDNPANREHITLP